MRDELAPQQIDGCVWERSDGVEGPAVSVAVLSGRPIGPLTIGHGVAAFATKASVIAKFQRMKKPRQPQLLPDLFLTTSWGMPTANAEDPYRSEGAPKARRAETSPTATLRLDLALGDRRRHAPKSC